MHAHARDDARNISQGASLSRRALLRLRVFLLALLYVVPGLVGHDPWKQDETYVTSIVHHIAQTGDWVVPTSAGQPFIEKPPLYYLVATATAKVFSPWFELHDGARLSDALWLLIAFGSLGLAARRAWPKAVHPGSGALLTLIACVGLVIEAHMLLVDIALLAGFALALLGFCTIRERALVGGALLGTGAGIGFLAKGLLAPGCLIATAVLLPALFAPWRTREYVRAVALAMLAMLPWIVVWPTALYLRSPDLFDFWLWQQNLGRFFGFAHLGADAEPWYYAKTLPWFAFPALPLALWSLWQRRTNWRRDSMLQLCVALATVIVGALASAGSMRALYLLPALLPMSLLAAAEVATLPHFIQRLSVIAAYALYGTVAVALWMLCLMIAVDGRVPAWSRLDQLLPTTNIPQAGIGAVTLAAAATLAWLGTVAWIQRTRLAGVFAWALGITLLWMLAATLLLPWLNAAKSYRSMFDDMREHLPAQFDCVASIHLGESEAAMLEYEGGIVAIPLESNPEARCRLVWVQDVQTKADTPPDPSWRLLWSGHRPGDTKERHRLFAR